MYQSPVSIGKQTLVLLGEAPGADEEASGTPFVGASGDLLRRTLLPLAGLDADNFHILNTFIRRPPANDLSAWTRTKTELKALGQSPSTPPLNKRYLLAEHEWQLAELHRRLEDLKPDLVIALGGTALWALTGDGAIGTHRGTFHSTRFGQAIATYHPAALLRQWSNLPLAVADLRKAAGCINGTLQAPLTRKLVINPSWIEMGDAYRLLLADPTAVLGVDIETFPALGQITTFAIGTPTFCICIPIYNKYAVADQSPHAWPDARSEVKAWRWIERFCNLPNPKVLQNGSYDSQWLMDYSPIDIRLRNWYNDTSILQHSLQPELPKALGTIASLYLNEPSWKQMRTTAKDAKADD